MNVSAITFRPGRVVGALGSGLRQSIAGRTAARCTPQGTWRAVLSSGGPCWASAGTAGLAAAIHEHKNADFVSKCLSLKKVDSLNTSYYVYLSNDTKR